MYLLPSGDLYSLGLYCNLGQQPSRGSELKRSELAQLQTTCGFPQSCLIQFCKAPAEKPVEFLGASWAIQPELRPLLGGDLLVLHQRHMHVQNASAT